MEQVVSQADLDEVRKVAQNLIDQDVCGGWIILGPRGRLRNMPQGEYES